MRYKLKNGGKSRPKAIFGVDGAITAAATLAAAGMTTAATIKAANQQAKAVESSARTQADAIKAQTDNNTALQKETMSFQRQINQENRQQQKDIQTTLQLMSGQQNMNDRLKATQEVAKYGGRPKRKKLSKMTSDTLSYGGARIPFRVTDGGGVIPIQTDDAGYGLYELYGNDHDHYHKTSGGKYKSGVGIKFADGSTIEGEGNQNSNQGELLYVTPNDNMFISKHSIKGFNPAKAVQEGMHPQDAFDTQQQIKAIYGINDDGSKSNNLPRREALIGLNQVVQYPFVDNAIDDTTVATVYNQNNNNNNQVLKCGGHRRLKCGGRIKKGNGGFWQNHAGATYNAAGNLLGAGIAAIGNGIAGHKLSNAYNTAGNILADAYSQMHGIDLSEISRSDYAPAHVMATVSNADTNINPQLERIRRDVASQAKQVNNSTMSSAARQQRLAGINDRSLQRASEQYAYKQNEDQKIQQANAERIQQASTTNAQLDAQANQQYAQAKLALMEYNNDIENSKIAGAAQARADAMTQSSTASATAWQNSMNIVGSALANTGQGFASSYEAVRKSDDDFANTYAGLGNEQQVKAALLRYERTGDDSYINSLLNSNTISDSERVALNKAKADKLKNKLKVTPGNILPDYTNNSNNSNYYA
nr:MAG: hypothetical protein [Bacteriophage sp.]